MNPVLGWALSLVLLVACWRAYGWQGVALAFSAIVFWLLLQFNRTVRVMKNASQAPVGHVDSAVMLNAKLRRGQRLVEIIGMTKSLGEKAGESPEAWRWRDPGGATVTVEFAGGRTTRWTLARPEAGADGA